VLACFGAASCQCEIIEELAAASRKRLKELGYRNVTVHSGDGYQGWPEKCSL